jgi:DNA-binding response OmpR family regulator
VPKQIITIIEDEASIRRFIQVNLQLRGYETEEADDGEQGLRLLKNKQPDLLILDYRLPSLNGEQILTAMLEDTMLTTVPVIFLSASNTLKLASFPNVCAHLMKPVDAKTLITTVQQFLPKDGP